MFSLRAVPEPVPTLARTAKAEQTRKRIVEAALSLLAETGYEKATMRAVAKRAGVSLGNAYYYFPSKEHLIQAFYARSREGLGEAVVPVLQRKRSLSSRLRGVLLLWLELIDVYHEASGALFKTAADPASPLNPFSFESKPVRDEAIGLFQQVVEGSNTKIPKDLRADLPALLWTYHMGITLFWIHDSSPNRRRTRLLIEQTTDLVVKLIALTRLPGAGSVRRALLKLFRELVPEGTP